MALLPMQVFVDESGAFDWSNVGMSVLAAVGVAEHDGTHRQLVSRLRHWERSLPRGRREGGEVKGRLVTDDELAGFVRYVKWTPDFGPGVGRPKGSLLQKEQEQ